MLLRPRASRYSIVVVVLVARERLAHAAAAVSESRCFFPEYISDNRIGQEK